MPDTENTDLGWLIQFLGRVNTLGKRGMRAALASSAALPQLVCWSICISRSSSPGRTAASMCLSWPAQCASRCPPSHAGCACSSRTAISCVRPTPMTAAKRSCASPRKGGAGPPCGGAGHQRLLFPRYGAADPGGAGPDGGPEGRLPRRHRGRERCLGARPCKQERRPRA